MVLCFASMHKLLVTAQFNPQSCVKCRNLHPLFIIAKCVMLMLTPILVLLLMLGRQCKDSNANANAHPYSDSTYTAMLNICFWTQDAIHQRYPSSPIPQDICRSSSFILESRSRIREPGTQRVESYTSAYVASWYGLVTQMW